MHLVLLVLSDQKLNNIEQNTKMFQHKKSTTKKIQCEESTSLITRTNKEPVKLAQVVVILFAVSLSSLVILLFACFFLFFFLSRYGTYIAPCTLYLPFEMSDYTRRVCKEQCGCRWESNSGWWGMPVLVSLHLCGHKRWWIQLSLFLGQ